MPLAVFGCPGRYVQGRNATAQLGEQLKKVGIESPVVILASGSANRLLAATWEAALPAAGYQYSMVKFNGECCVSEIERLAEEGRRAGAKAIVGCGGGKVLDTAKAAADLLQLPVACCPTVASSDAPCSALSVVYTPDGVVDHIRYYKRHPNLILVDTSVIAAAPKRLLVAGIGDALATYFEGRATYKSHSSNVLGGACTISGLALAKLCYETLLKDAPAACAAAEAGVVTPALERIVEANTLLSGLGFESAGLCVAHSVHNGLTKAPGTHAMLHGEKVAFGTVTQLVLEGRPHEELDTVYKFCLSVGLPVTLGQIGVDASDAALLQACADKAVLQGESCHNEPFKVTAEAVRDAMLAADALGRQYLAEAGVATAGAAANGHH